MDLHQKFVQLGAQRKNLTRQLQALLPEINRRKIYLQHGCSNIYEYAWKFAGFSKFLVEKVIRVTAHLENKPFLKALIEKEGIHKVALVATIATPETDKIFAKNLENMSKPALFEFAKELRQDLKKNDKNGKNLNLFQENSESLNYKCNAAAEKIKIEFDEEMQISFLQFKKELKKEFGCEFSHKEGIRIMLNKWKKFGFGEKKVKNPKRNCADQKNETEKIYNAKTKIQSSQHVPGNVLDENTKKRPIKACKKRPILEKFNYRCAYPNCKNPYDVIHHRDRFSLSQSHDSIIPLCKIHHEFAHNGLIKNEKLNPEKWELNYDGSLMIDQKIKFVDELFLKYSRR